MTSEGRGSVSRPTLRQPSFSITGIDGFATLQKGKAVRAFYNYKTFGEILDRNRGAGKGFDLLRLGLALLILVSHMSSIVGHSGTTAWLTSLFFGSDPQVPAATAQVVSQAKPVLMPQNGLPHAAGLSGISGPFIRALVPMFSRLAAF